MSPPPGREPRYRVPATPPDGEEVDVEQRNPGPRVGYVDAVGKRQAGTVHEHVEVARALPHLGEGTVDRLGRAQIRQEQRRVLADLRRRRLQAIPIDVQEEEPIARQRAGDPAADARGCAGDQDCAACSISVIPRRGRRARIHRGHG